MRSEHQRGVPLSHRERANPQDDGVRRFTPKNVRSNFMHAVAPPLLVISAFFFMPLEKVKSAFSGMTLERR